MVMAPTFTPTAAARWFRKSPMPLSPPALNCATSTSPNPALRICFCTIPEGAFASELQDFPGHAWARRPGRSPQSHYFVAADLFAAADVRVHLRPRDGRERLHAPRVQKLAASRHHGPEHGGHGHLGGGHAADFRVSIYPRDRRPAARADGNFLGGRRESGLRHAASARGGLDGDSLCVAAAAARR